MASIPQPPKASTPTPKTPTKKTPKVLSMSPTLEGALENLNLRYAYVIQMAKIVRIPTLKHPEIDVYAPETFTSSLERSRVEGEIVSKRWIDWPKRRNVYKLSYEPGRSSFTPEGNLNTWLKSPIEPKKGDLTLWFDYLDRIFASDPTYRDWFLAWLAYPIQHPGTKLNTACVFWSHMTATGKSMLGRIMTAIYGETNSTVIKEAQLNGDFNHWLAGRQFVMIEEIKGRKAEEHADSLKALITQQTAWINTKYRAQYELRDCANYYFNSNHSDPLYLEKEDRRFFVHNLGEKKYPHDKWRNEFEPWAINGGYAAIHYFLKYEVDLSKPIVGGDSRSLDPVPFSPNADAPQTQARTAMINSSRSDAEEWVDELIEWPANVLRGNRWSLATMKELFQLFQAAYPRSNTKSKTFATVVRKQIPAVYSDNKILFPNGTKDKLYLTGIDTGSEEFDKGNKGKNLTMDTILSVWNSESHDDVG